MIEFITFLLAPIGYAGLTYTMVMANRDRLPAPIWRAVVLVIVMHVFLVWHVRYEWQLSEATRNGYVGFAIFHAALAAILASQVLPDRIARRLITGAFFAITVGAIGATFRYDEVAMYRLPVVICAVAGIASLAVAFQSRARRA